MKKNSKAKSFFISDLILQPPTGMY